MLTWLMLFVYIVLVAYIIARGVHCIRRIHPILDKKRVIIPAAIAFILACIPLILGAVVPFGDFRTWCHKFSNFWLGYTILLVFTLVVVDIIVLILKLINRKKKLAFLSWKKSYAILCLVTILLPMAGTIYGYIHSDQLKLAVYEDTVDKSAGSISELNIVVVSDQHVGYNKGCDYMQQMVDKVNELNPDLVIFAGDIVDNEYEAIEDPERMAEIFRGIKSKYGVYGIWGNHDVDSILVGGFSVKPNSEQLRDDRVVQFMKDSGITMLEDETVLIANSFYIVGRQDGMNNGKGDTSRMAIDELTSSLDKSKPIICLAHEPNQLDETAAAGVDICISGHTHAGQFFPLTIVQPLAWKNYWGEKKFGNMTSYVTSGVGVYGPDMRLFTDSEVMQIKVTFN